MVKLKIIKGPGSGQNFELKSEQPSVLGRGEECDIRLASNGISKQHCRFTVLSSNRIEVEDMGSANGTFVNGLLIKKHILKPGDAVGINNYLLKLVPEVPNASPSPRGSRGNTNAFKLDLNAAPEVVAVQSRSLGEKIGTWLEYNVFPWADRLSGRFDVRFLVVSFFGIWSTLIIAFTLSPFSQRANERVEQESLEVARLYARQMVRVNQQAIIEQRYGDLVTKLDARAGQTPGLIDALIFDVEKGQILAPAAKIGQSLPNRFAVRATQKDSEFSEIDRETGTGYASAPIRIGTPTGNQTAATAFVIFNTIDAQFSLASLLDYAVNSLLYALLATSLFLIFLYRWVEGSLRVVTAKLDIAMKKGESTLTSPLRWPAMAQLCEQISFVLGRSADNESSLISGGGDSAWASAAVGTCTSIAAAAFDSTLKVTAWNEGMEKIIGIRANMAVGSDISEASRDMAFETAVRELSSQANMQAWIPVTRAIEFSGTDYTLSMVAGDGAILATLIVTREA